MTRRWYIYGLLVSLVLVLVAGCGQPGPSPSPEAAKPADKAAQKPAESQAPKPAAKAEAKPAEKAAQKPAESQAPKPAAKAEAKPAQQAQAIQRGGTLRIGARSDLQTMDPHNSSAADLETNLQVNVFNSLVRFRQGRIVPELAESWTMPDSSTYIFKLIKGVKFHDGTDFNAAAVKFNIDRLLDPNSKLAQSSEVRAIKSVEVVDDYTVKFTTDGPFAPMLAVLSDKPGRLVSPAAVQKYGADIGMHPVGTGPFQFVEWVKGDHLTLKRFDGYWRKDQPYLDQAIFRVIPDDSVRLIDLRSGSIDLVDRVLGKDIAGAKADNSLAYMETSGLAYTWFRLNTSRPPFDNKALRQALSWAVDREAINKALYFGFGTPATGPVTPALAEYFDPNFKPFTRDLAKAKAKLAEGGRPNGFKFTVKGWASLDAQVSQAVKAQVAEVGIDMDIQMVDLSVVMAALRGADFDAVAGNFSGRLDPSQNIERPFASWGNMNYGKYSNPQLDDLLRKGVATANVQQRKAIYQEAQRLIADDAAYLLLHFDGTNAAMSPKLQGYELEFDGLMRLESVWLKK